MKKLLSLVLALMMFAVPVFAEESDTTVIGGADEPTGIVLTGDVRLGQTIVEDAIAAGRKVTMVYSIPEFAGLETGDPMADAAINDLLSGLGMKISMQGDEYDMGLSVAGNELLTMGLAVNGEDAYVRSNLIGGTVVLSMDEIEPLVGRLLDMMVMLEGLTAEDAAAIKEQLPTLVDYYGSLIEESMGMMLTQEDLEKLDYSALKTMIRKLTLDLEEIDEIVVPRMCDPATYGVRLSIDNEEFAEVLYAVLSFIKDNPKLMNFIASESGMPTEAALDQTWEMYGAFYQSNGWYEDKEAFLADNPTFAIALDEAMEEVKTTKFLDGEFVTCVYMNDEDEVVYLTSVLPMFTETGSLMETDGGTEPTGTKEILNVVYTRQTVAQGVSHVCNIDVDGEGTSIDVLEQEASAVINVIDMKTQELILNINAKNEVNAVSGTYAVYAENEIQAEGEFLVGFVSSESVYKADVKLSGTAYETVTSTQESAEVQTERVPHTFAVEVLVDYALDGVDFNGKEQVVIAADEVRVVIECNAMTSDPTDSIMSGMVVRPAELDDAEFANWFVGAYNSLNSWTSTALMGLPQSVLVWMFSSSGMMQ